MFLLQTHYDFNEFSEDSTRWVFLIFFRSREEEIAYASDSNTIGINGNEILNSSEMNTIKKKKNPITVHLMIHRDRNSVKSVTIESLDRRRS